MGSSDSAFQRPPAPVRIVDTAGGTQGMYGGGWVANWLICCWGIGRVGGRAGPEIREEQIMLEIASCSVCNQDQTGFRGWGGGWGGVAM